MAGLNCVVGVGLTIGNLIWFTLMGTRVPNQMLGRVSSLDLMISFSLTPLSNALTGPVAAVFGVSRTLLAAGLLGTIVTVGSMAALKPGLIGGAPYGAAKAGVLNFMGHLHTVLRDKGIRATTVMPAEVDTPILDNRPLPPDDKARATMMLPEDVAQAILLCVTLPARTVVEEMVLSPTRTRDQSRDIEVSRNLGASPGAP